MSHATGLELEPLARSILLVAASVASMPAIIRPGLRSLLGLALVGILYVVVCLLPFEAPSERLHLLEYGLLPALVAWAMPGGRTVAARLGAGVLVAAGLGLIDEMTQGFTPGRVAQLQDVVVNAASGVAGALTAWILMPQGRPLRSHAGQ